jgi:hypothetical protein
MSAATLLVELRGVTRGCDFVGDLEGLLAWLGRRRSRRGARRGRRWRTKRASRNWLRLVRK